MPCKDVTELLELFLDQEDRLRDYRLTKRTCGADISDKSLLASHLAGQRPEEILAIDLKHLLATSQLPGDVGEFLQLKHLSAVQEGLRAMLGYTAASPAGDAASLSLSDRRF